MLWYGSFFRDSSSSKLLTCVFEPPVSNLRLLTAEMKVDNCLFYKLQCALNKEIEIEG